MLRAATSDDLVGLRDLERSASTAALGHVFPPQRFPYPDHRVLARWVIVLDDPEVEVLVEELGGRLIGLTAYDGHWLRHLAVDPRHWGTGLADRLLDTSLARIATRGATSAQLWVLADNHRARRFYERAGWLLGDEERTAEFPPHPIEVTYASLPLVVPR